MGRSGGSTINYLVSREASDEIKTFSVGERLETDHIMPLEIVIEKQMKTVRTKKPTEIRAIKVKT